MFPGDGAKIDLAKVDPPAPAEFYSWHNHLRPIYRYKRAVADKERERIRVT